MVNVPVGLDAIQKASRDAEHARDADLLARARPQYVVPQIFVRSTRPEIPVRTPDGRVITTDGMHVASNDVFIHRRLRDGSLSQDKSVTSSVRQPPAPEPVKVPAPEPNPEPAAQAAPLATDLRPRLAEEEDEVATGRRPRK
jgi:hypothetical protein